MPTHVLAARVVGAHPIHTIDVAVYSGSAAVAGQAKVPA